MVPRCWQKRRRRAALPDYTQQSERERLVGLEHCVSSNCVNENQRRTDPKKFSVIVSVVGWIS